MGDGGDGGVFILWLPYASKISQDPRVNSIACGNISNMFDKFCFNERSVEPRHCNKYHNNPRDSVKSNKCTHSQRIDFFI